MAEEDVLDAIASVQERVDDIKEKVDEIKSLMDNDQIYIICSDCRGGGIVYGSTGPTGPGEPENIIEETCPTCNGVGKYVWGQQRE